MFKIVGKSHCHCEHPKEAENMQPWDTLREFWNTCTDHEFNQPKEKETRLYYVTGTLHGSHIHTYSEGDARHIFHSVWKGESIIHLCDNHGKVYQKLEPF